MKRPWRQLRRLFGDCLSNSGTKPEEDEHISLTGTPLESAYPCVDPAVPAISTSCTDALSGAVVRVLNAAGGPPSDGPKLQGCQQAAQALSQTLEQQHRALLCLLSRQSSGAAATLPTQLPSSAAAVATPVLRSSLSRQLPSVPASKDAGVPGSSTRPDLQGSNNPLYEGSAKPSLIQRMQEQHRQELQELRQELEQSGERQLAEAAAWHAEALAEAEARHHRALQEALAAAEKWQQQLQTMEDSARRREESLTAEVAQLQARLHVLGAEARKARHAGKEQHAQHFWGRENLMMPLSPSGENNQARSQGQGRSTQVRKGSGTSQEQARLLLKSSMQRSSSTVGSRLPLQASN